MNPHAWSRRLVVFSALSLAVAACGSVGDTTLQAASPDGSAGSNGVGSGGPAAALGADFPCEVASLLARRCLSCHGDPPEGGAPSPLLRRADFLAPSGREGKSVGQVSLERLQGEGGYMPPKPAERASADELTAFAAWVSAGMPEGSCTASDGGVVPPSPYDTPETCSSGKQWTQGNHESPLMRPGGTCLSCHAEKRGPRLTVGGTVYPSAHEPDDCAGANRAGDDAGATVELIDANGTVHTLAVNASGNFYKNIPGFAFPYTANVKLGDRERAMTTPADDGDCNGCHTNEGTDGAPGRIMLP